MALFTFLVGAAGFFIARAANSEGHAVPPVGRAFIKFVLFLLFVMWAAASVAGASMALADVITAFAMTSLGLVIVILYSAMGKEGLKQTTARVPVVGSIMKMRHSDWLKARPAPPDPPPPHRTTPFIPQWSAVSLSGSPPDAAPQNFLTRKFSRITLFPRVTRGDKEVLKDHLVLKGDPNHPRSVSSLRRGARVQAVLVLVAFPFFPAFLLASFVNQLVRRTGLGKRLDESDRRFWLTKFGATLWTKVRHAPAGGRGGLCSLCASVRAPPLHASNACDGARRWASGSGRRCSARRWWSASCTSLSRFPATPLLPYSPTPLLSALPTLPHFTLLHHPALPRPPRERSSTPPTRRSRGIRRW